MRIGRYEPGISRTSSRNADHWIVPLHGFLSQLCGSRGSSYRSHSNAGSSVPGTRPAFQWKQGLHPRNPPSVVQQDGLSARQWDRATGRLRFISRQLATRSAYRKSPVVWLLLAVYYSY
jgi:hypothetical protein